MPATSSRVNTPDNQFPPERNYSTLTLRDLLEARHHYHVHLAHLPNVVGTAVGRYLIREGDWFAKHPPNTKPKGRKPTGPRTLFNSVVTAWSWPCVLVFVNSWVPRKGFLKDPDRMVPRALYLPDGRVIPTCTVLVQEESAPSTPDYHLSFANSFIGGGYLTYADVQGQQHLGSLGCLVTDGDLTYALTNRHVTGAAGREMYTSVSGKRRRIGVSHENQISLAKFTEMYRGWPGDNVLLHLDAGLIRIDNIANWTTQVAGMGPLGEWLDLTTDTLTLDIIDQDVRAFGAASGEIRGKVAALFYRYSTAGGTDYVTDFLIRPRRPGDPGTLHGDSGTLWFWEQWRNKGQKDEKLVALRPFAMEWGGHTWVDSGKCVRVGRFALAAALSTICRELNVTLLRDWNSSLPEYWGPVGHYTIGHFACEGIGGKLGTLMEANQNVVSYPKDSIKVHSKITKKAAGGLVPLADVPDRIWAHGLTIRGGADNPNHFADMDKPDPLQGNKTLLQLCENPANVNTAFWSAYYTNVGDKSRGCVPFRVWQFFDEMVDAVKKGEANRFVAAAGIMAHYVGDACQPLHISHMFNGLTLPNGEKRGDGVHSAYEEDMLRQNAVDVLQMMENELKKAGAAIKVPKTGHDAAVQIVKLMQRTFSTIKPVDIVDAFADGKDLWPLFGTKTVKVMADGTRVLRAIWKGAWKQGQGDTKIKDGSLKEADHQKLIDLYMDKTWMPSKNLKTIGALLK
ncbi:MAG TPA: hypothetical protein VN700_01800 [Vicinamibacterales bacterium]|nr:hypothetical protein [Vicinamibacterales bacterium]